MEKKLSKNSKLLHFLVADIICAIENQSRNILLKLFDVKLWDPLRFYGSAFPTFATKCMNFSKDIVYLIARLPINIPSWIHKEVLSEALATPLFWDQVPSFATLKKKHPLGYLCFPEVVVIGQTVLCLLIWWNPPWSWKYILICARQLF